MCSQENAFPDGCSGAPWSGSNQIQHEDFFSGYALQSGQSYAARPPWNVAGVDYAVGISAGVTLKDPTVNANLPSGCTYSSITNWVTCSASSTNVTFDLLDFSLHNCVRLIIGKKVAAGATITISNSKFIDGPGCEQGAGSGLIIFSGGSSANLTITNDYMDAGANLISSASQKLQSDNAVAYTGTGTILLQYCAFLNAPARIIEPNTTGDVIYQYNYIEGIAGSTAHGEFAITNSNSGTIAHFLTQYNTFLSHPRRLGMHLRAPQRHLATCLQWVMCPEAPRKAMSLRT